eukprot:s1109_g2.t1
MFEFTWSRSRWLDAESEFAGSPASEFIRRTPEIQTLKDILKLVAATEEEPSDAAADSDAEGARGPGDDNDPGAGPAPASSAADEVVQEGAPVPGDNGQASTAAGENGQASSVAGENGQASSVAGENGQASSEDLKEVPVAGDGEPAGTAESGVAADPSMVDTQVPMAFMQHGEEEVHEAVIYAASRKLRPPVPAFAYEVPLTSPAPTLPEVAPQAEVRAKSFPVDPPLQESAPALAEVAEEVPATKSSPGPTLSEEPEAAEALPSEVDRRFSISEDSQNPFPNPEEGCMSSDRVDMQVNQMATEPNARTADKVRKLEAGVAFIDVYRYFQAEKKVKRASCDLQRPGFQFDAVHRSGRR